MLIGFLKLTLNIQISCIEFFRYSITIDKGRYASESYLDKAPEAVAANQKQEVDYFDISRASVCFYVIFPAMHFLELYLRLMKELALSDFKP